MFVAMQTYKDKQFLANMQNVTTNMVVGESLCSGDTVLQQKHVRWVELMIDGTKVWEIEDKNLLRAAKDTHQRFILQQTHKHKLDNL